MARNFFRRIECVFPIRSPKLLDRIINHILKESLADNTATLLQPDGSYAPIRKDEEEPISSQKYFMRRAEEAKHQDELSLADR